MKNKKAAVCAAVCAVVLGAGGLYFAFGNKDVQNEEQPTTVEATDTTVAEETTETTTAVQETEEFVVGLSDEELSDSVKAELANINATLLNYIANNKKEKSFITEYGFLFDDTAGNTVTVKDLVKAGVLQASDEVAEYTDILYIRASDLAPYADNIDAEDTRLQLFTAYNNNQGYFVSNDFYSEGALIEKAQYEQMVLGYSFIHGEVRNPQKGSEEYNAIMAAVDFEGEYDVKHIACDDLYAVVVVGSLADTTIVKEYMLTKESGKWSVGIAELEASENPRQQVNMEYPEMELGLLPKYTISNYGKLQNGFTKYEQALVQLEQIKESDLPATYDCGVSKFAYMEFGDKKFIGCVNDAGKLEFYPVNNVQEAIAYMLEYDNDPPVFIINFHN